MTPDQPISLAVAFAGGALSLALPRRYALVPLGLAICLYPSTLLTPPVQLSLTPQRIIAIVLLCRCILTPGIRERFRWQIVDTVAMVYFALLTIGMMLNLDAGPALNNRAGFFLSAMAPYFCARLLITDRPSLYALLKGLLWAAVPLAILGVVEMRTLFNPWDKLRAFGVIKAPRLGDGWREFMGVRYARARGPFIQYIMYGWFFALLMAMGTCLYFQKRRIGLWLIPWCFLPVGIIASICGGPRVLAMVSMGLMAAFPLRRYWKAGLWAAIALLTFTTFYSNRGPMELIASFGQDENSSWYRVKLVRLVLYEGGMNGHWFTGYGDIPGEFGGFHDLCIQWVWLMVVHGIMGLAGFYAFLAAVGRQIWKARNSASTAEEQYLLWSMMATFVGSILAMLVVTLFSETYYIYHMLLGAMANASLLVGGASRRVMVLARGGDRPVLLRFTLAPGQRLALVRRGDVHDGEVIEHA